MYRKKIFIAVTILFHTSIKNFAQDVCVPSFKYKDSADNSIAFNHYMLSKFHNDFFKYFGNICGQFYDVIKFKINHEQEVVDIRYNAIDTNIQKFIKETLASTKGMWGLTICNDNGISKDIEMPLHFLFTDPCGTIMKTTYYTDTIPQSILPITIDGLKIQLISGDRVTLCPIKLNGPIIQKYHFIDN